ncbi:MAG TPA: TolC family protein [Bacteroidales bacterium]|nr:TolC family protein [Bacteroidales bacterium]
MKNNRLTAVLLFLLTGGAIFGQAGGGEMKLSLKEAQDYALQNNKSVKTAQLTVEASQSDIWSTISSGLPQVSFNGTFQDNFKLGVFVITFNGAPAVMKMGMTFNIPASIQAGMPIFNAPYYIGIETVRLAKKLSESNLRSTEIDTRQSVAQAYYLILISEESKRILKENLQALQETLKSTRAMFSSGLAEATDVDQMSSNVTMTENSFSNLQNNIEINYNLLRFLLGVKSDMKLTLTESLDDMMKGVDVKTLLSQNLNASANIQFDMMDKQEKLAALNLRAQKAKTLPTLSGFYANSVSGMSNTMPVKSWFTSSYGGFQLTVPIFASGQKYTDIRKAKINLDKARLAKEMVTDQMEMQEKQLKFNLSNANLQYMSQKSNVDVAKRVYGSMENKYKQGVISSLELTQANQLYLQAENSYVSSMLNLLQTKLALDKLLSNN